MTNAEVNCSEWLVLSGTVAIASMVIPIVFFILNRKEKQYVLFLFFIYCLATLSINTLELVYYKLIESYKDSFRPWLEITDYQLVFFQILHQLKNFALLGWVYSKLIKGYTSSKWLKNLIILLCTISIVFYIVEKGWRNYGTVAPTIEAIFLFIIPFFYLWYLFRTDLALPLQKNPFFWISLGLVIPNLLGLFLYFVGGTIQETDYCLFTRYAITKNGFEIIGQIMFAVAFSKAQFAKYVYSS